MRKKTVYLVMQHKKVAVLNPVGKFLKFFKVSIGYQHEIATYLYRNSFKITKETARNFPYLEYFTS
ncbi:MAG: hypothetical protein JRI87_05000 [Deltaproteobacteria bacterium]|jgi:hypothetical protein|nr:hypothetical protein [Deltaproteobacteria bacterium]